MSGHFVGDFLRDSQITVKQEPIVSESNNMMHTSASVPIPTRRIMDLGYPDYALEIDNSQSPLYQDTSYTGTLLPVDAADGMLWTNRSMHSDEVLKTEAFIHMDEDDIFQVDKADLIQGPTLAELNANDDTLLGDLNFDDLQLPEELYLAMPQKVSTPAMQINNPNHMNNNSLMAASSCPQSSMLFYRDLDLPSSMPVNNIDMYSSKACQPPFSPSSQTNSSSPLLQSSPLHVSPFQQKHSTLQELLVKREIYESPDRNMLGQSMPGHTTPSGSPNVRPPRSHMSRLSTSAPTHLGLEQIWQRREPRKHLLSTGSIVEAGSTSSLSTGGVLSPDPQDFSHDDDSDEDSDGHYEDYSSDNGGDSDDNDDPRSKGSSSKRERYFWQYNVQAKGPKGERLVMKTKLEDPHVLHEVTDPVFSTDCSVKGIKHSGKARKGDGNDLTPNARKLFNIGKELDKLSHIINDMTPVSELPVNVRPKTRKEKNKLASRACRLKKKAQHEANKIKLSGLETEHKRLINGIGQAKSLILAILNEVAPEKRDELINHMDKVVKSSAKIRVAGYTTEYVNKILDKVSSGSAVVGLDDL